MIEKKASPSLLDYGEQPPLVFFDARDLPRRTKSGSHVLFDWPRTRDEDVHESPGALLPVGTGRHVGDADQRPK
jgi:hypothetical protein